MLVRVLIAVLMTVGPLPFRVCTCAASAEPVGFTPAHEDEGCPCGHDTTDDSNPVAPVQTDRHSHHDHDCPAVSADPIPAPASEAPTPVTPADVSHVLATLEMVCVDPRLNSAHERPAPVPAVPLYLSFRTLRN